MIAGSALPGKSLSLRPTMLTVTAERARTIPQAKKRVSLLIWRPEPYRVRTWNRPPTALGGLSLGNHRRGLVALLRLAVPPERRPHLSFDLQGQLRVVDQELFGVVAPLAEPGLAVREEGTRFLDQILLHPEVEQTALAGDPDPVLDVELRLAERGGDLVLDDFDPHPVADRLGSFLQGLDAADVEALRGVELQRPAARLGLRRAELDADLFADLVGEETDAVGPVEVSGQFPHRLRHQPSL